MTDDKKKRYEPPRLIELDLDPEQAMGQTLCQPTGATAGGTCRLGSSAQGQGCNVGWVAGRVCRAGYLESNVCNFGLLAGSGCRGGLAPQSNISTAERARAARACSVGRSEINRLRRRAR